MGSQFYYHSFSASSASSINRNPLASTSSWFGLHTIFKFPFYMFAGLPDQETCVGVMLLHSFKCVQLSHIAQAVPVLSKLSPLSTFNHHLPILRAAPA